ncbi:MAG: CopG family ribbon-helix-helix protein [Burkholderiales bacterium]
MTTILSVSIPKELRTLLDAEAKRERRSRSFIVAEAVRQYLARQDRDAFTAARDQTLREGLALAPADRLKLAEELWQELAGGSQPAQPWIRSFETFDEYEAWRRQEAERAV